MILCVLQSQFYRFLQLNLQRISWETVTIIYLLFLFRVNSGKKRRKIPQSSVVAVAPGPCVGTREQELGVGMVVASLSPSLSLPEV